MMRRDTVGRNTVGRAAAALAAAAGCAVALVGMAGSAPSEARPVGSLVPAGSPLLRLEGRWNGAAWADTTVNSGSRVLLRFTGHRVAALISDATRGAQFYSRIDGGPPVLHTVERMDGRYGSPDGAKYGAVNLAPRSLRGGTHTAEIDVKDVLGADRWSPPLRAAFVLTGFLLGRGARVLPPGPAPRRRMLFLGDSITEGIRAAGPQLGPSGTDATHDYAWLTGRAFHADFSQVGFAAQGIFHRGDGGVPAAPATLRYNYRGSPASQAFTPQVVVVNQGTNDEAAGSARFEPSYLRYLRQIHAAWPSAWILAMRPFDGMHAADIAAAVRAAAGPRIVFVDTAGWLRPDELTDGLHPAFAGHLDAAARLEAVISHITGWAYTPAPAAVSGLMPARLAAAAGPPASAHPHSAARVAGAETGGHGRGRERAGWTASYGGRRAIAASPAGAGAAGWHLLRVTSGTGRPLRLPAAARDLFAYVSVPSWAARSYDALLTVTGPRQTRTVTSPGIPVFRGFLPWDRIHISLAGWSGPVTGITVAVRGGRRAANGDLPFLLDDIGWTNLPDG